MGHKVNPDIFRLGVTKTWSYQLRTNKNFIKNLFIFRLLKNLFMNYNIPLFTWKKHRNTKINDKLVLKGEKQISKSPFIVSNVLFSHVYFGMLSDSIYIESFFIEAGLNQSLRKLKNPENKLDFKAKEYQPWQSGFYKKRFFQALTSESEFNKMKLIFSSRKFRRLSRKTKIYRVKSISQLSKDFYYFSKNYNPKYNPGLRYFFKSRFEFSKKTRKATRNSLAEFYQHYYKRRKRFASLYFVRQKKQRLKIRFKTAKALRYLRTRKYYRLKELPNYSIRKLDSKLYKNMLKLSTGRAVGAAKLMLKKKSLPKMPLKIYNMIIKQIFFFSKIYKNLKLLKYFIRVLKFFRHFSLKKKIFYCHNLVNLLMNFISLTKSTIIAKKLFLIFQTMMYYSYSLSFWNFINMKKKYLSKFVLYKAVSKTLYKSLIELASIKGLSFSVTSQNKYKFGSSLVLNYILIKLGQYFNINEIVNPLSFFIKHLTCIAGYKILIRGRLTRKERAAVMIRSGKKMPLSTISANVDYAQGSKIMKFGMVGIKVYLLIKPSNLINLYKFNFRYAKTT